MHLKWQECNQAVCCEETQIQYRIHLKPSKFNQEVGLTVIDNAIGLLCYVE